MGRFAGLVAVALLAGCSSPGAASRSGSRFTSMEHNDVAVVLEREGRFAEAEAHLRQAVKQGGENYLAWTNLGNVLRRQGRMGEAIQCYEQALRIRPEYGPARHNLGRLLQGSELTGAGSTP